MGRRSEAIAEVGGFGHIKLQLCRSHVVDYSMSTHSPKRIFTAPQTLRDEGIGKNHLQTAIHVRKKPIQNRIITVWSDSSRAMECIGVSL